MASEHPQPRKRRSFTTRQAEKSAALAIQTWRGFFRDLAIRTAAIIAIVLLVALIIWILRH